MPTSCWEQTTYQGIARVSKEKCRRIDPRRFPSDKGDGLTCMARGPRRSKCQLLLYNASPSGVSANFCSPALVTMPKFASARINRWIASHCFRDLTSGLRATCQMIRDAKVGRRRDELGNPAAGGHLDELNMWGNGLGIRNVAGNSPEFAADHEAVRNRHRSRGRGRKPRPTNSRGSGC